LFLLIVNDKDVPIVIAGNKVDLADEGREIFVEDVKDWVDQQYRQNR
jgi:GTPase SAR1 family protein